MVRHKLDREVEPSHSLVLTARDGGRPALTGSVSITVSVDDVNDNSPIFEHSEYNVSLPETTVQMGNCCQISLYFSTPVLQVLTHQPNSLIVFLWDYLRL